MLRSVRMIGEATLRAFTIPMIAAVIFVKLYSAIAIMMISPNTVPRSFTADSVLIPARHTESSTSSTPVVRVTRIARAGSISTFRSAISTQKRAQASTA